MAAELNKGLTAAQYSQRAECTMRTGFTPSVCVWISISTPLSFSYLHVFVCACPFSFNWDVSINATGNKLQDSKGENTGLVTRQCPCFSGLQPRLWICERKKGQDVIIRACSYPASKKKKKTWVVLGVAKCVMHQEGWSNIYVEANKSKKRGGGKGLN